MKRADPNKAKSIATSELQKEGTVEQSKQTTVGSSKACSSAAMIGLAAISTTMGASGILWAGAGDRALAAEPPTIDTNQEQSSGVTIPELDAPRVNRPRGSLLQKLTQGYVEAEGSSDSLGSGNQLETILPSGQKIEDKPFTPIEIKQTMGQTKAMIPNRQPLVVSESQVDQFDRATKAEGLPALGELGKPQIKKALSFAEEGKERLTEELKVGVEPAQEQQNRPAESPMEWKYEESESVSESVGKSFDSSQNGLRENTYQKQNELVIKEPALQIVTPEVADNPIPKAVIDHKPEIVIEPIKAQGTKVPGAVVIDSEMTSTPVLAVYRVGIGETLALIARQHGLSVEALAAINQINDPNVIEVGQLLKIPQQSFSESLTLAKSTTSPATSLESNSSWKQDLSSRQFSQAARETTTHQVKVPQVKLPVIESEYLSDSIPSVTLPTVAETESLQLVSWSQGVSHKNYQKNQERKEFPASTLPSVATHSPKTPLVHGKVWPNSLESSRSEPNYSVEIEVENNIQLGNDEPVQALPVETAPKDIDRRPVARTEPQENPYSKRLRGEIIRLRQEYDAQKQPEASQAVVVSSESIPIPVPEPLSSENTPSSNPEIPTHNTDSRYLQPTDQREISSPQSRQWPLLQGTNRPERVNPTTDQGEISSPQSRQWPLLQGANRPERVEPTNDQGETSRPQSRQWPLLQGANRPERANPVRGNTVVVVPPIQRQINQSQKLPVMAAAPIGANADEILNNPSLGKMVSPDLPPLDRPDTYLPGGSMQFTGYTWPAKGELTSGYGWRWGRMHRGIDIAAPTGTPIVAAAPGVVTYADWNSGGYGYLVEIQHPDGSLTVYAHNNQILVREGQKVAQGELIAEMGSTGRSTGPHLHFEIHPTGDGAVNPMAYLPSGVAYN